MPYPPCPCTAGAARAVATKVIPTSALRARGTATPMKTVKAVWCVGTTTVVISDPSTGVYGMAKMTAVKDIAVLHILARKERDTVQMIQIAKIQAGSCAVKKHALTKSICLPSSFQGFLKLLAIQTQTIVVFVPAATATTNASSMRLAVGSIQTVKTGCTV